jgi:hypothetical protein
MAGCVREVGGAFERCPDLLEAHVMITCGSREGQLAGLGVAGQVGGDVALGGSHRAIEAVAYVGDVRQLGELGHQLGEAGLGRDGDVSALGLLGIHDRVPPRHRVGFVDHVLALVALEVAPGTRHCGEAPADIGE